MGTPRSSSELPGGAQFAGNDHSSVTSFPSCHVFGDSGLYGVGIRTGYYLQYFAALLSLLLLPASDQQLWLLSFLPLAAAHLIGLSLTAAEGGLVILDWAIVFGLIFWSIVFLAWPVVDAAFGRGSLGAAIDPSGLRQDLERDSGRAVTDQEAEWHGRYVAVLRAATATGHRDTSGAHRTGDAEKHAALEAALRDYVTSFASARFSPASVGASSYILDLYADTQLRDIAARMLTDGGQLESFRDGHTEALRRANVPFNQAQSTTQTLGRLAVDGEASNRGLPWWLLTFGAGSSTGTIALGLGLTLYSGFSAFMVWLLFRAVHHGSHGECNVRFIFFLVPASVYNPHAITALQVLASIWLALAAIPSLAGGVALLALGAKAWWDEGTHQHATATTPGRTGTRSRYDTEKGKETEIPSPVGARGSRASEFTYEMDELPLHHHAASPSPTAASPRDTRISSYHSSILTKDVEPILGGGGAGTRTTRAGSGVDMRGGLAGSGRHRASWAGRSKGRAGAWKRGLLLLPVVHTIVVVELTIHVNEMDMRRRGMTSMGELLAFFLGLVVLVGVVARCLRAARGRAERKRQEAWEEERREILLAPATRLGVPGRETVGSSYSGGGLGGGLRRKVSEGGESVFSKELEMGRVPPAGSGKQGRRIYLQPERKSGSSMSKFREMIDEDDEA